MQNIIDKRANLWHNINDKKHFTEVEMKTRNIKILALILAIVVIISSLPIFVYAAQPTSYSKNSNSGTRDEICTSLSGTSASSYYTGSYTYANLITLSSSSLKTSLNTLMKSTHKYISSYDDCHYKADMTDCEGGNGKVTLIYTSYQATMSQWNGWNREHVWPQSLGGGNTSGGGADLHHIRPSDKGVNSSRGNKKYGNAGSGASEKYGSDPAVGVLGGTYNNTYFEPLDNVKGDVARICLYVYVRWGSEWGADSITEVFQSVDVLLEWCEMDPVDTWEMGRNEVVQNIQGNRNVFIDYPELAWQLYDREVPEGMITPSGAALNGEVPDIPEGGGSQGGNEGGNEGGSTTPDIPAAPAEIPESFILNNNGKYVTATANTYTSSSGTTKKQYKMSANKDDAAVMSLVENSDGTVSIKYGSKYLMADGTNVEFVSSQSDNTKFVLEPTNGGYFVKCATATYQGKAQYLEVYKDNLTCYGMGADTSIYTFVFEGAEAGTQPEDPNQGGNNENQQPDDPNQGGNNENQQPDDPNQGGTINPPAENGLVAEFDFGANGSATHNDGKEATGSKTYNANGYTLTLTGLTKVYADATDAKGNSCLKIGTGSATGGFSFTVGDDIDKVIIYVAKYKAKNVKLTVNGTEYAVNTSSDDGAYTEITIDTTVTKTVTLATSGSSTGRCMVNTIEFYSTASTPEINPPEIDPPETDSTPDETETLETEPKETDTKETDSKETDTKETDTKEPDSKETDTNETEPPYEDESSETNFEETESKKDQTSETPKNSGGCGSSISCGAIIITVLCVGISAVFCKKKEN